MRPIILLWVNFQGHDEPLKITKIRFLKILRPDPNAAPLMCRTKLNTVRLWSDFRATADSDGVLASDLIREGHGKQFSMRIYAF